MFDKSEYLSTVFLMHELHLEKKESLIQIKSSDLNSPLQSRLVALNPIKLSRKPRLANVLDFLTLTLLQSCGFGDRGHGEADEI